MSRRFLAIFSLALLIAIGCDVRYRDRPGGYARFERLARLEGVVLYIDPRRRAFSIRDRENDVFTIIIPIDASARTKDQFPRIRVGDSVRLVGRFQDNGYLELEEFR